MSSINSAPYGSQSGEAKTLIEERVAAGDFESRYQADIEATRSYEWFRGVTQRSGAEEAERRLQEWVQTTHRAEVASSIQPAALGMAALANSGLVRLVAIDAAEHYPILGDPHDQNSSLAIFMNRATLRRAADYQPRYADKFGPGGKLGLVAVTLQMAKGSDKPAVQLGLILPYRANAYGFAPSHPKGASPGGHIVGVFTPSGDAHVHGYQIDAEHKATRLLDYMVGFRSVPRKAQIRHTAPGFFEDSLGTPEGGELLVSLPDLGAYLLDLAAR